MIVVLSLASMPLQSSFAASRTVSVDGGLNTITYRDLSNLESTPEPVISLDKTQYHNGDTAILTITDFNANLDVNAIDSTSAIVNSNTVPLTETSVNSGEFQGQFRINGNVEIEYTPDPTESAREIGRASCRERVYVLV